MLDNFIRRLNLDQHKYTRWILSWYERHGVSESGTIMFTAFIVGIGTGLGSVFVRWLIEKIQFVSYEQIGSLVANGFRFDLLIIPAVGGLIVGPMIYFYAREAKGHGVPEVMEAVALRGGRIRPRVAVVKALASSVSIGTGGSIGREGPLAQIGSALGSTVGQWLKLPEDQIRTLVAAGAAGGIAAAFNAPIAASLFALEVILNRIQSVSFGAVVISAVIADVIAHIFEGDLRAFPVPEYSLKSPWELLLYVFLGAIAAVLSFGFSRLLYFSEDRWDELKFPEYLKPLLGGLVLGLIGILTYKVDGYPRVFGVGYESVRGALFGELALQLTIALLFLKMLATVITLGSGASGGVFAPALFMGAMTGQAFGQIANQLFPAITAPPGAYALVGMSAFFSGAAHAPITSILILFEMTGNYEIILPLMLATVMSTLVSRVLSKDSIYTLKLTRRGVRLDQIQNIDVMQGITVAEAMSRQFETVRMDMSVLDLMDAFEESHHHALPVLNENGSLAGVVSIKDVENLITKENKQLIKIRDIATTSDVTVATPEEPMWMALQRLGRQEFSMLPVVERHNPTHLIGVIRRRNVVHAYNQAIARHAHHQHRAEVLRLGKLDGAGFFHFELNDNAPVVGQRVKTIALPPQCLLVSVRRKRKLRAIHGDTILQAGDQLTVFAHEECVNEVRQTLIGDPTKATHPKEHAAQTNHIFISEGNPWIGKPLQSLSLPPNCILAEVTRAGENIKPHGDLVLEAGDELTLYGEPTELEIAIAYISSQD